MPCNGHSYDEKFISERAAKCIGNLYRLELNPYLISVVLKLLVTACGFFQMVGVTGIEPVNPIASQIAKLFVAIDNLGENNTARELQLD